jgi:hypothetical protein
MAKPPDAALAHDKASEARECCRTKCVWLLGAEHLATKKRNFVTMITSNPRESALMVHATEGVRHAPNTLYSRCRHSAHCRRR